MFGYSLKKTKEINGLLKEIRRLKKERNVLSHDLKISNTQLLSYVSLYDEAVKNEKAQEEKIENLKIEMG
jgi:hypothetical protein